MSFEKLFAVRGTEQLSADEIFDAIEQVARLLARSSERDSPRALDIVVRLLEARRRGLLPEGCRQAVDLLAEECGLYPYISPDRLTHLSQTIVEAHAVKLEEKRYLHSKQLQVLLWLLAGDNVILSAPTSFGKTLLVDAYISKVKPSTVVMVMPTIALIDETRRRLRRSFGSEYSVITTATEPRPTGRPVVFVLTQERFLQRDDVESIDFLFIDEFYKLDPSRDDGRYETLNLALYRALPVSRVSFMAGPHIRGIELGARWSGNFRFVQTDYRTVTVNVIDRSRGGERLELLLGDIRSVGNEASLIFTAAPAGAERLAGELVANEVTWSSSESNELAEWLHANYHPAWTVATTAAAGIAPHHGRLPRALGQLFVRFFDEGVLKVLVCTSTLIEGVNTSAANVFIYDKAINRTDFDFFSFANIRGRVGRMMRHFVGNAYLYHEPPQEIETRVKVPVLADPGSASDYIVANVSAVDLSEGGRARQQELEFDTGLSVNVVRRFGSLTVPVLQSLNEAVSAVLRTSPRHLRWSGFPDKEQRIAIAELALKVSHSRGERTGLHTSRQVAWAWNQLQRIGSMPKFLRWFAGTFGGSDEEGANRGLDEAFQFLQACEFGFPRAIAAIEALVSEADGVAVSYGPFLVAMENWFRPPWMKQLDEAGVPLPICERLAPFVGRVNDAADAARRVRGLVDRPELSQMDRRILVGANL